VIASLVLLMALQVTPELREHVEAGMKAKAAGDLDTAAREFERVAALAPSLAAAHVNLGAVYLEKKDYARAIPALRKALELNSNLPGAEGMLGAALLAQGYSAEAIPHLEKAQADDLLGVALLDVNRPRDAIDRLEAAMSKRPNDPDLIYYLAEAHERLSHALVDRLRHEAPDSARARQLTAEALAAAGNRAGAEKEYRAALAARTDLRGLHLALGELFLDAGDYEKAEPEFQAEAALAPGSAMAAYRLGQVLLNRGRVKEATAELRRADELQPDMPETQVELGKALASSGDLTGAEKLFLRVLKVEQTSLLAQTAHFQLAQIYRKQGRDADADRELAEFRKLRAR